MKNLILKLDDLNEKVQSELNFQIELIKKKKFKEFKKSVRDVEHLSVIKRIIANEQKFKEISFLI